MVSGASGNRCSFVIYTYSARTHSSRFTRFGVVDSTISSKDTKDERVKEQYASLTHLCPRASCTHTIYCIYVCISRVRTYTPKLIISVDVRDKEGESVQRNGNSRMEYGGAGQKLKRGTGGKSTRKAGRMETERREKWSKWKAGENSCNELSLCVAGMCERQSR